jgi:GT2 family glycosyltransferase
MTAFDVLTLDRRQMNATAQQRDAASVVIVAHNGLRYLEGCLSTLLDSSPDHLEIVVIDNASMDGSADWVEHHYPQVRLIKNPRNSGFAVACNQGAELSSGDVLVFLNQDTRVEPGWLDALVVELDETRRTGLSTSQVLLMAQPDRVHVTGQDVHFTGLVFGRGYLSATDSSAASADVAAVSGASFAVRRRFWETLGGFDETFFMYYEETDLSWRARLAGDRCRYTPASIVYHDYSPIQPSINQLYHSFRNRYLLILKNWRWRTLILLFPGLCLAEFIECALSLAHGRKGLAAKVRANLWLLTHMHTVNRLHHKTQAARRVSDAEILAEREYRLAPKTFTGGSLGRLAVAICNVLFWLNYRVAHWLSQRLS